MAKSSKNMARLFFAVALEQHQKDDLEKLQQQPYFSGKQVNSHSFHLTLQFLGNCSEQDTDAILDVICNPQITPFSIIFDKFAYFTRPKIGAIEANNSPQSLLDLRKFIHTKLTQIGIRNEHFKQQFRPHITLFRNCEVIGDLSSPIQFSLPISNFCLMQSFHNHKGSYYETIHQWPLYKTSIKDMILQSKNNLC